MKISDFISSKQYRYFYNQLSDSEEIVYESLYKGFTSHANTITCFGCTVTRVKEIYHMLKYDIPELFFVKTILLKCFLNDIQCTVIPEYRFGEQDSINIIIALNNKYRKFIAKTKSLPDIEKEQAIHDLIVSRVKYKDVDAPYSHEAPGVLLYNIGVCDGISKAFKFLADRVGLNSIFALGVSNSHENANGHAWNIVEINNVFYHIDVTFDATIADACIRYDYFNLSDEEILTSHTWTISIPICIHQFLYYRRAGLYFETKSELATHIKKVTKKSKLLVFQVPKFYSQQDKVVKAVRNLVEDNICCSISKPTQYCLSYNSDRMVFQIQIST